MSVLRLSLGWVVHRASPAQVSCLLLQPRRNGGWRGRSREISTKEEPGIYLVVGRLPIL